MTCKDFPRLMSAQADGCASEREQMELQNHLRECAACCRAAADLRGLRADLHALETPRPASALGLEPAFGGAGLTAQIQTALRREARLVKSENRRRADRRDWWLMRFYSQGIGAAVSLLLFFFVALVILKPAYRALALAEAAQQVAFEEDFSGDTAIRFRVMIAQPPPPPAFSPDAALLELGVNMPADTEIIATVKVDNRNGRATLDYVVGQTETASDDSLLADRLASAFYAHASFQPPGRAGINSDNAVILFGKVNISAHLD